MAGSGGGIPGGTLRNPDFSGAAIAEKGRNTATFAAHPLRANRATWGPSLPSSRRQLRPVAQVSDLTAAADTAALRAEGTPSRAVAARAAPTQRVCGDGCEERPHQRWGQERCGRNGLSYRVRPSVASTVSAGA